MEDHRFEVTDHHTAIVKGKDDLRHLDFHAFDVTIHCQSMVYAEGVSSGLKSYYMSRSCRDRSLPNVTLRGSYEETRDEKASDEDGSELCYVHHLSYIRYGESHLIGVNRFPKPRLRIL